MRTDQHVINLIGRISGTSPSRWNRPTGRRWGSEEYVRSGLHELGLGVAVERNAFDFRFGTAFFRGVEASFLKTTGNKTLEFGGVSPFNDPTRYKMKSFYFYLT
jgi:hypothetical protein